MSGRKTKLPNTILQAIQRCLQQTQRKIHKVKLGLFDNEITERGMGEIHSYLDAREKKESVGQGCISDYKRPIFLRWYIFQTSVVDSNLPYHSSFI